jgi:hypothetical protein
VRQRVLPVFAAQRGEFALRFTCEHCTYFDVEAERCTHGYPTHEHRAARYEPACAGELVFCKEFELE